MGLDASVTCACFRQGRIVSPFPAHTMIDDDGELTLDFPELGHEEDYARFHEWLGTGGAVCEHPGMVYLTIRISTWGGVHHFQAALEEAGWDQFPMLHAYLPEANGGQLPASAASAALEELQIFKERYTGSVPVLVNVETGVLEREEGFYTVSGDYSPGTAGNVVGMDREGVYVEVSTPPPARSFRSRHFEQQLVPKREDRSRARYEIVFRDMESGETCVSPHTQYVTRPFHSFPLRVELRVELRTQRADRFTYILEPLEQILQAAHETGNPVRWW